MASKKPTAKLKKAIKLQSTKPLRKPGWPPDPC
jgi:hypothetical protein